MPLAVKDERKYGTTRPAASAVVETGDVS